MDAGTKVRFVHGTHGLVEDEPGSSRFTNHLIESGAEGTYVGPHATVPEWGIVEVGGRELEFHVTQFEETDDNDERTGR